MTDAALAAHLAECAGRILLQVRDSGMFGPRIDVLADADAATQVLAFYGRRDQVQS